MTYFNHPQARITLGNKLLFHYFFDRVEGLALPELLGAVIDGVQWRYDGRLTPGAIQAGEVVAKPISGNSGGGVMVTDDLSGLAGHVVQSRLENHAYAHNVWPEALNTVRVLVARDGDGEPFVVAAVHRFGSAESPHADNWSSGGVSASVSLENGVMGPCVASPRDGELRWSDTHPSSGARISGQPVAEWDAVLRTALRAMTLLPGANWVGWDIAVTGVGPVLIEGNDVPDVNLMQVHGPLLADARSRAAFDRLTRLEQIP